MTLAEEREIIELSKRDPSSFETLYNYNFKKVYYFIFGRVGEMEIAGDLCSQVFLKALTHIGRYEHQGYRFSSWLLKIADNEVKYHFRKSSRVRNVVITDQVMDHFEETLEDDDRESLLQALIQMLQTLEEEALQLIEMRFFEQRSFKEIAYILNITEGNAKVRTYRLLDKLRLSMAHEKV